MLKNKQEIKTTELFFLLTGIVVLVGLIYTILLHGTPLNCLVWNGGSVGIFPDFYESVLDASSSDPYLLGSIYPAFAYLIFLLLSKFVPEINTISDWDSVSKSPNGLIIGFVFFALTTALILILSVKITELTNAQSVLFCCIFFLSPGYIYMIERGNSVILATMFTLVFVVGIDSKNKVNRNIALICLAMAAAMKIYPAIFGLMLIKYKTRKDTIRCIFYGIIAFFAPFLFIGHGAIGIFRMARNILSLSTETGVDTRNFGFGYKISVSNFVSLFQTYLGINIPFLGMICLLLVVGAILFLFYKTQKKWQAILLLTFVLTIIPGFSWIYNAVYYIIPLVFFIRESEKLNKFNVIYVILFTLIFAPLPFGYLFKSLDGVNKVSYSTLAVFVASILFIVVMMIEILIKGKGKEGKNEKYSV